MKRYAVFFAFALLLLLPTTVAAAECQFILGFKTLRSLIGHDVVGECLENEHHGENGDSLQQTTGGLLVWRKADNWTAFTDGYRSWVNGPYGLEQRLNTQRFQWEIEHAIVTLPRIDELPWLADDLRRLSWFSQPLFLAWMEVFGDNAIGSTGVDHFINIARFDEATALRILQMPFLKTREEGTDYTAIWILADLARSNPAGLQQVLSHPRLRGGITDDDIVTVALLNLGLRNAEAAAAIEALAWVEDGVVRPAFNNRGPTYPDEYEEQAVISLVETAMFSPQAFNGIVSKSWIQDDLAPREQGAIVLFANLARTNAAVATRVVGMPFLDTIGTPSVGAENRILQIIISMLGWSPGRAYWLLSHPSLAGGIADEHEVTVALLQLEWEDSRSAIAIRALPWLEDGIADNEVSAAIILQQLALQSKQMFQASIGRPWIRDGMTVDEQSVMDDLLWISRKDTSRRDEATALRIFDMPFLVSVGPADAEALDSLRRLHFAFPQNYLPQVLAHPRLSGGIRDDQTALVSRLGAMPQKSLELLNTLP